MTVFSVICNITSSLMVSYGRKLSGFGNHDSTRSRTATNVGLQNGAVLIFTFLTISGQGDHEILIRPICFEDFRSPVK